MHGEARWMSLTAAEPSDGELLARVDARDSDALAALYDRHAGLSLALARRILGSRSEAEEITQEVFLQVWKGPVRYDPERGRFSSWLYTMVRNRSVDRLRSRRAPAAPLEATRGLAADVDDPEQDAAGAERRRSVLSALARLPSEQRTALELCYYEGLTHREIAERLGEPLGTIKSRIKMAVDKLKRGLGGLEAAP
jgi:RNA polymerase sigma-70 factor (ECF subfamily)